ncbi:metal ABC transporter permease [Acidocella sp.]|uniref:metal ABC transporter permease n=1 Tax=Acidocella sp. TaxID=50710 RepID=UPI002638D9E5|nr:metal ABC transporter permease [Acidocella sp.]
MFAPYLLDGWLAATLVALAAGCAGFFVVARRETFAAHALPMAAFPGAAAASLLGVAQVYGLIVAAGFGTMLLLWLKRRQRNDTATALALVSLLGLGALFLSLSGRYAAAVYALLFGQVFGLGPGDVLPAMVLAVLVPLVLLGAFRPLLLSALSPELASRGGMHGTVSNAVFLLVLALTSAFALPVTGALLVFSLMTGPAAAACLLARAPGTAMALSVGLALALIWAALALSYLTGWPAGFFTGVLAAVLYLLARMWRRARQAR